MVSRLLELQAQYRIRPDGWTRYRLVRHEQLLAQWAPSVSSTVPECCEGFPIVLQPWSNCLKD
jgi:hypothetical protein